MSALAYRWDGEALRPLRPKLAAQEFLPGGVYWLEQEQRRSEASHRHEFAWLRDAWENLPEALADRFATPDHLRKAALIEGGFYSETIIDCGAKAAALRVAAFARGEDEFAHVVTRGPLVVVRKAKSQSRRSMTPNEFEDSKKAIIRIVSTLIGVTPDELMREAGRAA